MDEWAKLAEQVAQRFVEADLSRITGRKVKMTKRQFNAYCKQLDRAERKVEIEQAIALLEANGYRVLKAK